MSGLAATISSSMPVSSVTTGGIGRLGFDERDEAVDHLAGPDPHGSDLGDLREPRGASGRLQVDHAEGGRGEPGRRPVGRGEPHQVAAEPREPGVALDDLRHEPPLEALRAAAQPQELRGHVPHLERPAAADDERAQAVGERVRALGAPAGARGAAGGAGSGESPSADSNADPRRHPPAATSPGESGSERSSWPPGGAGARPSTRTLTRSVPAASAAVLTSGAEHRELAGRPAGRIPGLELAAQVDRRHPALDRGAEQPRPRGQGGDQRGVRSAPRRGPAPRPPAGGRRAARGGPRPPARPRRRRNRPSRSRRSRADRWSRRSSSRHPRRTPRGARAAPGGPRARRRARGLAET